MSFLFLASKIHWYFKQGNSHSDHWAESGCVGSQVMSCKHFRIWLCLTISYSVFWILGLTCMGTLRGSSPYGSLNPFLDGWWWRLKLSPHKVAKRGQALVLYSDLGLQKQQPCLVQAQVVQAQGCSRGGYLQLSLSAHRYITLLLQWPVSTWIPCWFSSGTKYLFFFPPS